MTMLRAERERRGLEQSDIAELLKVGVSMVSLYERDRKSPKLTAVRKWLRFFGWPEAWAGQWFAWDEMQRARKRAMTAGRVSESDIARISRRLNERGTRVSGRTQTDDE